MCIPLLSILHSKEDMQPFWKCVGWCKWWFAQVGDTHLQGATPFLQFAGLTQVHQPLHTLAPANDFQVWWLEHIFEVCWHMYTFSEVFDFMSYLIQFCIWCVWNLQLVLFLMVFFGLICRSKLCPFWNFLLEGLVKICTTWCLRCHTSISLPIGMACHLIFTSVNLSST